MAVFEGFACDFIRHVIGGASSTGGFNSQQQASCRHVPGAGARKGTGRRGLGRECGGNVMGSATGKRGEGALGLEVVARWDSGVHYFV